MKSKQVIKEEGGWIFGSVKEEDGQGSKEGEWEGKDTSLPSVLPNPPMCFSLADHVGADPSNP